MSARSVLTVVGAGVGFAFGGPAGAAFGAQIGGAIGGAIDGPQEFEGPRLNDLRVGSSAYGQPIPLIYGPENRLPGNLIWTSGLIEKSSKKKQGGKGGPSAETTEYSYSSDVAIALGEGAATSTGKGLGKLKRIWCNGKLLVDVEDMFLRAISNANNAIAEATAEIAELEDKIDNWIPGDRPSLDALQSQLDYWEGKLASAQQSLIDATNAYNNYLNEASGGWSMFNTLGSSVGIRRIGYYPGDFVQLPDQTIEAKLGTGNAPAYRGTCYVVIQGLELADYGNSIPNIEFEIGGLSFTSVASVVQNLCQRATLEQGEFAVSGQLVKSKLNGYVISQQSEAISAIKPLETAFGFDTTEQGGQVRFVKRGRMAIAAIEAGEMAARERTDGGAETTLVTERTPDVGLPKLATITYKDKGRDYQENTQRAVRDKGSIQHKINYSTAVALSNDEARAIVDRILWEAWVGRMVAKFTVSDRWSFLRPGDVVTVRVAGVMTPFRIERFTRGHNGAIEATARMEDPFIYNSTAAAAVATIPANTVQFVGDTFAYAFNAPILYPTDSPTSFNWALDAFESGWRGGQIFRSLDGLTFGAMGNSKFRNTTGFVAGALGDASSEFWDRENVITVTLTHPEHELESFPEEDVLNGLNAFWLGAADGSHGEVLQFATATLVSSNPRVYELSDLLRGRRGTEHETSLHSASDVFVYFESGLMSTSDFGVPDWNLTRFYKGVSIYQVEQDVAEVQEFINTGEKSKPRSPVHAEALRDGANNISLTWVRRARGLVPPMGYGTVALDEASEVYEIDFYDGLSIVRTITATSPNASYSAAEQTSDGLIPGDDVTIKIYQISQVFGRGYPGEFTL